MTNRDIRLYFVIFFCLSAIMFFGPTRIDSTKLFYTHYALFSIVILLIGIGIHSFKGNYFTTPVLLIVASGIIASFSAVLFWNQSLIDSIKPLSYFLTYNVFFLLIIWKFRVEEVEKIFIIVAILYMIIHTLTHITYPVPIFGNTKWYDSRGFPRISVPGTGFMFLFSYYSLGKFLQIRKFIWLIAFLISLVFIMMTLTRTYIAVSFIFLALYALHKSKSLNKIIAVIIFATVFFITSQMNFFKILSTQTVSETINIENNVRVKAAEFYLFDFSPNMFTRIFGNGAPEMRTSYGLYIWNLQTTKGLFISDIGYIGLYSQYGLLAILAYLLFIFRTLRVKIPEEHLYCKYFLYYVFVISIIISSPFSNDFIIPIVLALYILATKDLSRSEIKEPA